MLAQQNRTLPPGSSCWRRGLYFLPKRTEWTAERLYALINRRWLEVRPTVCTTNLDPDQLREAVGERVFSRLVGNGAVVLRLTGHDRRRKRRAD